MIDPFRGDIPTLSAPDRAAWERDHGRAPIKLDAAGESHLEHARKILARDFTGLTAEEALAAQTDMESLCERVLAKADLDFDKCLCFFDPETNSFWAYTL